MFSPRVCEPWVDRALLHHRIDIVTPGIIIDQNIDGQFIFLMEPPGETSHASRWLTVSCQEDAVVPPPELVFRQAIPLRAFFDQEQELGGATTDLQILWLHD